MLVVAFGRMSLIEDIYSLKTAAEFASAAVFFIKKFALLPVDCKTLYLGDLIDKFSVRSLVFKLMRGIL